MAFIRYKPDPHKTLSPISINTVGGEFTLIPGETVWLSDDELQSFLKHPATVQYLEKGEIKQFSPDSYELQNYDLDSFEEIIKGIYEIEQLDNFLDSMRFESKEYRFLIRKQIEKLTDAELPQKLSAADKLKYCLKLADTFYSSRLDRMQQAWQNQFKKPLPVN